MPIVKNKGRKLVRPVRKAVTRKQAPVRLGTRSSPLALVQARLVAKMLAKAHPGLDVELVEISTRGDEQLDRTLRSFGGVGVFVKWALMISFDDSAWNGTRPAKIS